jgi:hypothetical protein
MSARKNLSAMLGGAVQQARTVDAKAAQEITTPRRQVAASAPTRMSSRSAKWLTFERKETRQRPDQIEWIASKRKELKAIRGGEGERLTDDTLIRIALDLLMRRGDELAGMTEDQLRRSLGIVLEERQDSIF